MLLPVISLLFGKTEEIINLNITFGKLDDNLIIEIEKNKTVKDLKNYLKDYHNLEEIGDKIFYQGVKLENDYKLSSYGIKDGDLIEIVFRELKM